MPTVPQFCVSGRLAWPVCCGVLLAAAAPLAAQEPMSGETPGAMVRLFASDGAVLESQEARKDLPCTVTPSKPALGFDLKFHAGYEVGVPLKELAGDGNQLTMVFRVIPEGHTTIRSISPNTSWCRRSTIPIAGPHFFWAPSTSAKASTTSIG